MLNFNFLETIQGPPPCLTNEFCLTYWYESKEIRNVITSPAWRDRVKNGKVPYFCMFNGRVCRYFEDKKALEKHFDKNPQHRPPIPKSLAESKILKDLTELPPPSIWASTPPQKNIVIRPKLLKNRPPSPKEPHPDEAEIDKKVEVPIIPPLPLENIPAAGGVEQDEVLIIENKTEKFYPPTTTANLLTRLNCSMPKPDFLRSNSLDMSSLSPTSANVSRDPRRKRKSSLTQQPAQINVSAPKMTKTVSDDDQVPTFSSKNKQKISLAQYLKQNKTENGLGYALESKDLLPSLPPVNELFDGKEAFEPEIQGDSRMEEDNTEQAPFENGSAGAEEGCSSNDSSSEDELEQLLSKKKSSQVSSWTRRSSKEKLEIVCDKDQEKTVKDDADEEIVAVLVDENVEIIQTEDEIILIEQNNAEAEDLVNFDEPTSVAQVEVQSLPTIADHQELLDENTRVLIKGVDHSIDFCPKCHGQLCPFRGGYSINCMSFDVNIDCHRCSTKVIIKEAFNDKEKSTLWMSSVL